MEFIWGMMEGSWRGTFLSLSSSQQGALQAQAAPGVPWGLPGARGHSNRQKGWTPLVPQDPHPTGGPCSWFFPPPPPLSPSLPAAFLDNPGILSELCGTLSRLAIRNEFCQEVVDLGGLSILVSLLADFNDHQVGNQSSVLV